MKHIPPNDDDDSDGIGELIRGQHRLHHCMGNSYDIIDIIFREIPRSEELDTERTTEIANMFLESRATKQFAKYAKHKNCIKDRP
jgi:hypothetical protein